VQRENRIKEVIFATEKLRKAYEGLEKGRFEEKELAGFLKRAVDDLSEDPFSGTQIPSSLWPREYVQKYRINNLRKYDLPNGWRLVYTLRGTEIKIISIILEWYDHKDYERRFGYKNR